MFQLSEDFYCRTSNLKVQFRTTQLPNCCFSTESCSHQCFMGLKSDSDNKCIFCSGNPENRDGVRCWIRVVLLVIDSQCLVWVRAVCFFWWGCCGHPAQPGSKGWDPHSCWRWLKVESPCRPRWTPPATCSWSDEHIINVWHLACPLQCKHVEIWVCPYLRWIDLPQVSEEVVKTPGEMEREEAQHERCQHNDDHLHWLLLGPPGCQAASFAFHSPVGPPSRL